MSTILTILKRIFIVLGIAIAFTAGLFGAIYLSLRSSETRVPDIVGKDRTTAENAISDAGLNFRVRATRSTSEAKPDTVLIQLPHAGEVVKVGQTVAVDISRATEGEAAPPSNTNSNSSTQENNNSSANNSNNSNTNSEKKSSNRNTNGNKNANRQANRNQNSNANRNNSGAFPVNANTPPARANTNSNTSTPPRTNTNRGTTTPSPRRPPQTVPTP